MSKAQIHPCALVKHGLSAIDVADGARNGSVIDRRGFKTALVIVNSGDLDSGNLTVKVQHGTAANGSDMADFTSDVPTSGAIATDDGTTCFELNLDNANRYIRVVGTLASASTSGAYGVNVVLGNPHVTVKTTDFDDWDGEFVPA